MGLTSIPPSRSTLSATYARGVSAAAYGATGDGATDDHAALTAALAAADQVYVPPGTYLVSVKLVVPAGKTLVLDPGRAYFGAPGKGAKIKAASAAVTDCVIELASGSAIIGGGIIGAGKDLAAPHDGVWLGGGNHLDHVTITGCRYGIEGKYTGVNKITGCMVNQNWGSGLRNTIDSQVVGGYYNANGLHGIDLGAGANDNTITGLKSEWNEGYGFALHSTNANVIQGVVVDRNGKSGFRLTSNSKLTILAPVARRNGALSSGVANDDNHFFVQSNTDLTIVAAQTSSGLDDDGTTGYNSPLSAVREDANINMKFVGGNLTGCTSTVRTTIAANTGSAYLASEGTGASEYTGTGTPEGAVTAGIGSRYTDLAATNGAVTWIKTSGTGSTGWRVVQGDTGWRYIVTQGSVVDVPNLRCYVRRVNETVYYAIDEPTSGGTFTGLKELWTITTGFKPTRWMGGSLISSSGAPIAGSSVFVTTAKLDMYLTSGTRHYGGLSHPTDEAWPTSLPGSAA